MISYQISKRNGSGIMEQNLIWPKILKYRACMTLAAEYISCFTTNTNGRHPNPSCDVLPQVLPRIKGEFSNKVSQMGLRVRGYLQGYGARFLDVMSGMAACISVDRRSCSSTLLNSPNGYRQTICMYVSVHWHILKQDLSLPKGGIPQYQSYNNLVDHMCHMPHFIKSDLQRKAWLMQGADYPSYMYDM